MKRIIIAALALIAMAGSAVPQALPAGTVNISQTSTSAKLLVSAPLAGSIGVTYYSITSGGTTNFSLEYGTQTTNPCDTGATVIDGPRSLVAQTPAGAGDGSAIVLVVPPGKQLCALTSQSIQVGGSLAYVVRF